LFHPTQKKVFLYISSSTLGANVTSVLLPTTTEEKKKHRPPNYFNDDHHDTNTTILADSHTWITMLSFTNKD
jgi:hypothetical protein